MSTGNYPIYWVTDHLATGPAPMSYDHLDALQAAGIVAILNLCAEYTDLHEIEARHGFEVHYLPVEDEETPQLQALDAALEWLDESIYLGKKVYVHCRYGIGRTGTIISAYLLRRGLGSRLVKQKLKKMRSRPANFYQWWLVRKIGKREGQLTIREPSLEWKNVVDLNPFFVDFAALLAEVDQRLGDGSERPRCGLEHDRCCTAYIKVSLIESVYLMHHLNRRLHRAERQEVIERCGRISRKIYELRHFAGERLADFNRLYAEQGIICPLSRDGLCLVAAARPLACRLTDLPAAVGDQFVEMVQARVEELSQGVFLALAGSFSGSELILFPLIEVASGKFVQSFFNLLAREVDQRREPPA